MFTPFQVILVCVYWWLFTLVSGDIQLINYAAEVFHGLVCGLIMGDVKTGLEVGATMCLMGMGIGGFGGDASRVVSLTNCTNGGAVVIHENSKGTVGCGGFLGRTTALADNHTMQFTLSNCVFSGSVTIYNAKAPTATNVFGTVIGAHPGFAVTTIDGVVGTANVSVNYGTTSVTFATE